MPIRARLSRRTRLREIMLFASAGLRASHRVMLGKDLRTSQRNRRSNYMLKNGSLIVGFPVNPVPKRGYSQGFNDNHSSRQSNDRAGWGAFLSNGHGNRISKLGF